jgi:hypothetical protein
MAHEDEFKPIEDMLLHGNPNPERVGCPPEPLLRELALRQRPINDPLYVHLSKCSPCLAQIRKVQKAGGVHAEPIARGYARWLVAAAVLVVVAAAGWYLTRSKVETAPPITAKSQIALPSTVLDLRRFVIARGDEKSSTPPSPELNRTRQNVVLQLPVASADGEYALRLLDADLKAQLNTVANAKLENGITSISTKLDLSAVPAGKYTLALKREPEDWRYFPLIIR